jgi:uncharacterized membrane-anchored protein YjiN (DUF445 family)
VRLGQTTLTDDELRSEAKKHLEHLKDFVEEMNPNARKFIEDLTIKFDEKGDTTRITPPMIFWLRDLVEKHPF